MKNSILALKDFFFQNNIEEQSAEFAEGQQQQAMQFMAANSDLLRTLLIPPPRTLPNAIK